MPSKEYLEAVLNKAKAYLPKWLFNEIHQAAVPEAGAAARWKADEPTMVEKIALNEIRAETVRKIPDDELRQAWIRLHQWFANAKRRRQETEAFVNAAVFVMQEMERRGFEIDRESDLAKEATRLIEAGDQIMSRLEKLPDELVMVRDFVSVVGSNAAGKENPNDLDVLLRTKIGDDNRYLIQADNIWLPLRKVLDPKKEEILHWIYNEAGPHADFISLYDLVLRKKKPIQAQIVKNEPEPIIQGHEGVMVGFWLPEEVAGRMAVGGGEEPGQLHLTVTYHGKISEIEKSIPQIVGAVNQFAKDYGPLEGEINGLGRFNASKTSDAKDVVYATFDAPALSEFRQKLVDFLAKEKIPTKRDHGYTPHITLAYVDQDAVSPVNRIENEKIRFDQLMVAIGDARYPIPLKGAVQKAASEMPDWGEFIDKAPEGDMIDLGSGGSKPHGFIGLDKHANDGIDIVHDMESGLPFTDNSIAMFRANHSLEHLTEPEKIMREIHRALMPGGLAIITVPSTSGEGAFAHPDHKSFWNQSSFAFWTNPELLENRPRFDVLHLEERGIGARLYVDAVLKKPGEAITKHPLRPITTFVAPKPAQKGRAHTDAFSPEEIWEAWVQEHMDEGVVAEPKYNGFRAIIQHDHPRLNIRFEGSEQNRADALLGSDERLNKLHELPDVIMDCDIGVVQNGKRWSRPQLATLNANKPVLPEGARIVVTCFDLLFWEDESLNEKPFSDRREALEKAEATLTKNGVEISRQMEIKTIGDLRKAWRSREFGLADQSEGLVLKSQAWVYEHEPATQGMAKIKHSLEVKAIVLDVKRTKDGQFNFRGGLLPSDMADEITNTIEFEGKQYVDLGFSFNADFEAKKGDIITADVEEIAWDIPDKRLNWLGANPLDVDTARKEPYFAAQTIDLARRARVLQTVPLLKADNIPDVPSAGRPGARIAFVGASPGAVEQARGEPFVGPTGETLNDLYLKPLGLTREDVFLTNAVPLYLTDEKGNVREPKATEIEQWHGWLTGELERARPQLIVALGQKAKDALGESADFVLPHPAAIRRKGDSGERERKIKQIRIALGFIKKAENESEKLVEAAYAKALQAFRDEPDGSHTMKELMEDRLYRVKDGWGERYFMIQSGKAIYIAAKYADVGAFNTRPPLHFTRDDVKQMGWSDAAWDRAILAWLKERDTIRKQQRELRPEEDEPTRAEVATKFWDENWQDQFPTDGTGRFTYQHHWRGLSEEEARELSDAQLLNTDHSVHGDARFEANGNLWGISIFLGTTEANREAGGDRLIALPPDDNLQGTFKLAQPKAWLDVASKKPFIAEPFGVGATTRKWAKFFELDDGTYEMGVWREHGFEIFMKGDKIKGRFLIQFAPVAEGRRVWIVDRPEDQTPIAEKRKVADVIRELRQKRQKFLVWAKPGEKPISIQISGKPKEGFISADELMERIGEEGDPFEPKTRIRKEYEAEILKADDEKRVVTGIVLEPETFDAHGDVISAEEIEKAAHFFLTKSRTVGDRHKKKAEAEVVESYIAPEDLVMGGQRVKKGTWVISVKVMNDALWKAIKSGEYTGFSVGGFGIRE